MRTDIGLVRRHNEDAYGFDAEAGLYVVADGMGGAAAGDLASRMAVDTFLAHARQQTLLPVDSTQWMVEAVEASNRAVFEYAAQNPRLRGMGTTLVALHVSRTTEKGHFAVEIAHVGDSRCYRLRDGRLEQLTEDHSLVAEQVRFGQITQEEAEWSPMRNVITRAIGSQAMVETEIHRHSAKSGDVYLLCTDGLVHVPLRVMEKILNQRGLQLDAAAGALINAANEIGGPDNVTVMLVKVRL